MDGVNESLWELITLTNNPKQWADSNLKLTRAAECVVDSQWDRQYFQLQGKEEIAQRHRIMGI